MTRWLSQSELVELWGKSRQTVTEWAARPGAPKRVRNGKPQYAWPEWNDWWASERERTANKPATLTDAERRYETARAEKLELEVARMRGELVTVDEATAPVEAMLGQLRAQLVTLPQRWAPALLGCKTLAEMTRRLDAATHELMGTLAGGE